VKSHYTPNSAPSTSQIQISPTSRSSIRQETKVPQPSSPPNTNVADEAASTGVDVRHGGTATTVTSLDVGQGSGNIDKTPSMPQDSPLPRKVSSLETYLKQTKLTYGAAYTKLIQKVKKLENKVKSNQTRRRARIVVSDDEEDLEDPSKQGRKISEIDQDPTILLVKHDVEIQGRQEHDMEFEFDLDTTKDVSTAEEDIITAKPVSTVGAAVTTASVDVSTTTISTANPEVKIAGDSGDDIAAETLVYIIRSVSKAKDKGKGIMEESESTMTKTKRQQEQERTYGDKGTKWPTRNGKTLVLRRWEQLVRLQEEVLVKGISRREAGGEDCQGYMKACFALFHVEGLVWDISKLKLGNSLMERGKCNYTESNSWKYQKEMQKEKKETCSRKVLKEDLKGELEKVSSIMLIHRKTKSKGKETCFSRKAYRQIDD
ncbi:hypothetical protein Tco_0670646, partial [Tanacetum coccineum]